MPVQQTRLALKRWGFSRKATWFLYAEILLVASALGLASANPLVGLAALAGFAIVLRFPGLSMITLSLLSSLWGIVTGIAVGASGAGAGAGFVTGMAVFGVTLALHVMAIDHLQCTGEADAARKDASPGDGPGPGA